MSWAISLEVWNASIRRSFGYDRCSVGVPLMPTFSSSICPT